MRRSASNQKPKNQTPANAAGRWLREHATRIAAVWLLALLAYSNSFHGALVFDNASIIGKDTRIREATVQNVRLILTENYWYGRFETNLYRPATTLSYLFNYAILGSGANPESYHRVNFGLHLINIALAYLLLFTLLEDSTLAVAATAIWAIHPVLAESVTNIVGRADLLAALGVLAGVLCHIQAGRSSGKNKLAWLGGLAIAAAIGIFSKESGIVILAGMGLYDVIFRAGPPWRSRVPGYVAAVVPIGIFFLMRAPVAAAAASGIPFTDNPLGTADFWAARLTAIRVVGDYLRLLIWPSRLSCDYSYNQVPLANWGDWKALAVLLFCLGVGGLALFCWRRAKAVSFFIGFFFAALLPTSNLLFPIGAIMAERFLYLPTIAAAGCAVLAWNAAGRRWPQVGRIGPVVLLVICGGLAARSWARNSDWRDDFSLWSSSAAAAPNSYKTHLSLSSAITGGKEQVGVALHEAERAVAIVDSLPDRFNDANPYANAAYFYRLEGDVLAPPAEKTGWYQKALDALLRGRRIDQARSAQGGREFGTSRVYLELGRIYRRMSRPAQAVAVLEEGRRVAQSDEICEELAGLYQESGDLERAAVTYIEALSINPDTSSAVASLVKLYQRMDPGGCSFANGSINLGCPLVHQHLCSATGNVIRLYRNSGRRVAAESARVQAAGLGCPAGQ